jgi:hypothetical protein
VTAGSVSLDWFRTASNLPVRQMIQKAPFRFG